MIRNKKLLLALCIAFIAVEAALGVLLQTSQASIPINLRYTAVILACLFFVVFAEKTPLYALTQIALIFTVCADYFLVYLPQMKQLPAMIFFSVVQAAYFLRLYLDDGNRTRRKIHLAVRISASIAAPLITLAVLKNDCDALALVSMFYYANLALNAVFAFIAFGKEPLLAIGLLLFILCDTAVGLTFIERYIAIPADSFIHGVIHPGFDLAWAFYLPSQALIAISLLPRALATRPKKTEKI